jgi:sarcosine oxidase, subunit beta
VAVIGAGAVGLACALQLQRASGGRVVVVDRHPAPGMESSSRANGGARAQFTTAINIEFSRYTIERLIALDAKTNGLVGWRQVGYLFMTGTNAGEAALKRGFELQRSLGLPVDWLEPADVVAEVPFVRQEGLRAGTFCATDGIFDPSGVVAALFAECRHAGVKFLFDHEVTAIDRSGSNLELETEGKRLQAGHLVNAAGAFGGQIAALAGVELPVEPYRRNLACTQPATGFPDEIPMCVDMDTGVLIRREARGFLLAYSDPSDKPTFETSFDPAFLDALAERVGNRFPFLESIPIDQRKCWAGLYPETSDHHAIVDRSHEDGRLVHCVGFGGHGIMHSLAAGQAVAELVRDGTCTTFDLRPLRLSRFAEGGLTVETAVL